MFKCIIIFLNPPDAALILSKVIYNIFFNTSSYLFTSVYIFDDTNDFLNDN